MSLLPQKKAVRVNLEPFEQKTKPLAKIWFGQMKDDAHQPSELNGQFRVTKMKTRFRLSNLLRVQRNDCMTSSSKKWIEIEALDKGDLHQNSYQILITCRKTSGCI